MHPFRSIVRNGYEAVAQQVDGSIQACVTFLATTCNVDNAAARRAGEMLEAQLFVPMLRPLIAGAGTLGDYELDLLAQEMAHNDRSGFAALIASRLEPQR